MSRRRVAAAVAVAVGLPLAGGLAWAGPAGAATIQEFALPAGTTGPRDIVSGPNGALWVTVDGALVELRTSGAASRRTTGITPGRQPYAIAPGPGGTLLFTENDAETEQGEGDGTLGRVAADGSISELTGPGLGAPAGLTDVAAGPGGTAAYVSSNNGGLGIFSEDVDEDDKPISSYDLTEIEKGNTLPVSIAPGPDGRYWYTAVDSPNAIGAATFTSTDDGYVAAYQEYALPKFPGGFDPLPDDIVAGRDGAMWFTLPYASSIGRIDVGSGAVSTYKVSDSSLPTGIALGPDGALWFTDAGQTPGIGRIDPLTKQIVVRTDGFSGAGAAPERITTGPDGALWFTEPGTNLVGRVDPVAFLLGPTTPDADDADPGTTAPVPTTPAPAPPIAAPPTPEPVAAPVPPKPAPEPPTERGPRAVFRSFSYGVRVRAPRRARVSFRLSRAATVQVTVGGAATRSIATVSSSGRSFRAVAGLNRVTLPRMAPGLHVVRLRATTPDGRVSTLRARVRVLPARTAAPSFTG